MGEGYNRFSHAARRAGHKITVSIHDYLTTGQWEVEPEKPEEAATA